MKVDFSTWTSHDDNSIISISNYRLTENTGAD